MTEQTDAIVVVVSEETGQMSLVERARIVRNLDEANLARAIAALLHPTTAGGILGHDRTPPRGASVRELARRARFGAWTRTVVRPGKGRGRSPKASSDAETEEKAS